MSKKNILQTIREKEMDRKEFLKYGGILLLGIVGLRGVTSLLSTPDEHPLNLARKKDGRGFGGGKYGA